MEVFTSIISGVLAAIVTGIISYLLVKKKTRIDFERDIQRVRTEFMAEKIAKELLEHQKYPKRSFKRIKARLGGFTDEELRKILVRAGAVRFFTKEAKTDPELRELWGLMSRKENLRDLDEDNVKVPDDS